MTLNCVSRRYCFGCVSILIMLMTVQQSMQTLSIEKSAYKDIVLEIKDNVPLEECSSILADLEVSFKFSFNFFFN